MSVGEAFSDGVRRVARARVLVVGLWVTSVAVALPFALALRNSIADHLGDSLAADDAAAGVNFDWWNEFLAQASGLGQTFVPSVVGFAVVLRNLSTVADATPLPAILGLIVGANTLLSIFLLGGVLDRLARDRSTSAHAFFAACGVYFFRFLRLAAIGLAVYVALFGSLHPWFFNELYSDWTRDMTVERNAFAIRAGLYVVFGAVLVLVNVFFDYAKVRMVVEDRRSVIGAVVAAARFLRRQPTAALALYAINAALFLLIVGGYYLVAPGVGGDGASVWIAFLVGQLYILARVFARLVFAASQIALFQGRLAHVGYVARPVPRWPESPAAAALRE